MISILTHDQLEVVASLIEYYSDSSEEGAGPGYETAQDCFDAIRSKTPYSASESNCLEIIALAILAMRKA